MRNEKVRLFIKEMNKVCKKYGMIIYQEGYGDIELCKLDYKYPFDISIEENFKKEIEQEEKMSKLSLPVKK